MANKQVDILDGANKFGGKDGYEIPFDLVPLPSEGRLYDEDHPLYNEENVEVKAMTNLEENILTSRSLIRRGEVVDELIKACLLNKSIDPSSLLVGDKSAILLAIRISGFGHDYLMKTVCPECDNIFNHKFDLRVCRLKKLGTNPVSEGENLFSYKLEHSGRVVKFKLLTAGDEKDISDTQEARKKAIKKATGAVPDVETNITDKLIKSIVSIDGEKDKTKLTTIIRNMLSLDSRPLREYIDDIEPDMEMTEEVKCPRCGALEEHQIPMGTEFLWPKRRKLVRTKSGLSD